jgi:hypothetical protein
MRVTKGESSPSVVGSEIFEPQRFLMRTILANAKFVSSSDFYVRIRALDGDLPVNIDIERAALDSVSEGVGLSNDFRWRLVEANLKLFVALAESRYIQGAATEGKGLGGRFSQVILRGTDLRKASIQRPEQRTVRHHPDVAPLPPIEAKVPLI